MDYKHNKEIIPLAKALRKNMTKEEKHLWYDYLRQYPIRFIRQKVIGKWTTTTDKTKVGVAVDLSSMTWSITKDGGAISGYAVKEITLDGCTFSGNTDKDGSCDVWYRGGTLSLKGATSLKTVKLEAGKAIALNDSASFAGTVTLTGAGAVSGAEVLTGSMVADYHGFFAPADSTLKVDSTGTIVAK